MRSPSRAIIIAVTGLLATLGACTFNPADNQRSRWPVVAISAPEGMATDLSSVSRIAWSIVNRVGPHLEASLLYDWLDIHCRPKPGRRPETCGASPMPYSSPIWSRQMYVVPASAHLPRCAIGRTRYVLHSGQRAFKGLKMLPDTTLERLPRMADFALWASACETAIWPAGTFWSAYCGNRDEVVDNVIEADPVAAAVRAVMEERTEWTGTATDLLGALAESAGERVAKSKTWPASPRALSGRLRQAATFLRKIGIEIDHVKEGRARTRIIHIKAGGNSGGPDYRGVQPSAPSALNL